MDRNGFDFNFREIADAANDIIVVTSFLENGNTAIVYTNPAFTRLTEYTAEEVVGRDPRFLQGEDRDQDARKVLAEGIREGRQVHARIRNYSRSGHCYWLDISLVPLHDAHGEVTHFAAIERDISAEVHREERLQELARTDELTGLLNRRAFDDELRREFGRQKRYGSTCSLLLFDIDHFKEINDEYGHSAGDAVLESLGDLCQRHFREQDVIGRIGGEEFSVILPETGYDGAMTVAERFRRNVADSAVMLDSLALKVTVSIGVVEGKDFPDTEAILEAADEAMYAAKESGRNRVCGAARDAA